MPPQHPSARRRRRAAGAMASRDAIPSLRSCEMQVQKSLPKLEPSGPVVASRDHIDVRAGQCRGEQVVGPRKAVLASVAQVDRYRIRRRLDEAPYSVFRIRVRKPSGRDLIDDHAVAEIWRQEAQAVNFSAVL